MSFSLLPKVLTDCVTDLSVAFFMERGIKLVMLDFDNTIVPYTTNEPTERVRVWLEEIKQYAAAQMDTLWEEYKRLRNPHVYKVDLSDKLYDLKRSLINSCTGGTKEDGTAFAANGGNIYAINVDVKEDGTVVTNPGPDVKIVARCAEADNTARVLRFARQGKQDIAL